jgi:L,D-peptidoglycan transpeptidase YkuD (ErfK/YbiS/YcfS/YnhG family)
MKVTAFSDGRLRLGEIVEPCALGRTGAAPACEKREGDGRTPLGLWPLREVFYRADRVSEPVTALPKRPLQPEDGWCDAPEDLAYNRWVRHPYPASAERLWREDGVYDLLVVLGYNDDPVRPFAGSAIFLHLARPDYAGTEGCVATHEAALRRILAAAAPGDSLEIKA